MAHNSTTERLLSSNAKWRPSWTTPVTMGQMRQGAAINKPLMIITCMDPRCEPTKFLGSEAGPFATVSNAGGRATADAVRSILVFRSLFVASERVTVAVVQHTDCGVTYFDDQHVKDEVKERTPAEAARADAIEFGTFAAEDLEDTIRKDVQSLKDEKMLEGVDVLGFNFITETGELKLVC
ncbi:carbonic anhydrase [Paraphoma chrysanthemicola]|uniref:Carbonic anhydrase n=1 Tax=Paraphoma chrysanthemicola TaxID=798071 RepID=A0A8K0QX61_9PLEO|nr:carbonic anhydrase [Paraphoma chrysanthemicola]